MASAHHARINLAVDVRKARLAAECLIQEGVAVARIEQLQGFRLGER